MRSAEPDQASELDQLLGLARLAATPEDVARLTRPAREARVDQLMVEAKRILTYAIQTEVYDAGRGLAATVHLFSGGNDSTTLGHLLRDRFTHAAHANTGIGIEATRQYVRDTCATWGLPLLERRAPHDRDTYRAHVLAHGFPGSGMHHRMYQRLKERALEQVRNELVRPGGGPYKVRVVFVAGRRRTESEKRGDVPAVERKGSTVWASPLVNWTKLDLNTYRLMHNDVPANPVAEYLHMSGECLCGCYAKQGEREMLLDFAPQDTAEILELEALIADRDDIPTYARTWGWSWDQKAVNRSRVKSQKAKRPVGYLCDSCESNTVDEPTVVVSASSTEVAS